HPPRPTPFPYTTLFRSRRLELGQRQGIAGGDQGLPAEVHEREGAPPGARRYGDAKEIAARRGLRGQYADRQRLAAGAPRAEAHLDRKSTRLNSSHSQIS